MKFQKLLPALMLIAIALLFSVCGYAQNVSVDKNGNYISLKVGKPTGKFYLDEHGKKFPVLITGTGKLYVRKVSVKTNKEYNYYLKLEPSVK